jgi:hypothetical protein
MSTAIAYRCKPIALVLLTLSCVGAQTRQRPICAAALESSYGNCFIVGTPTATAGDKQARAAPSSLDREARVKVDSVGRISPCGIRVGDAMLKGIKRLHVHVVPTACSIAANDTRCDTEPLAPEAARVHLALRYKCSNDLCKLELVPVRFEVTGTSVPSALPQPQQQASAFDELWSDLTVAAQACDTRAGQGE